MSEQELPGWAIILKGLLTEVEKKEDTTSSHTSTKRGDPDGQ